MKKRIDIEKLLKWAYCEELPKAGGGGGASGGVSSWMAVAGYGELMATVDDNQYGVVPDFSATSDPDPDAVAVHVAVLALDQYDVRVPSNWTPMPELGFDALASVALQSAKDRLFLTMPSGDVLWRRSPSDLVRKHAILGADDYDFGAAPEAKPLRGPNGGELWFRKHSRQMPSLDGTASTFDYELEDGWDQRRAVPKRGAYRKFRLEPDPVPALVARQEYVLWVECLRVLAERLSNALDGFEIEKPRRPLTPWRSSQRGAQGREAAILPDLRFFS